ncbi:MAG: vitamin K epoxide reductase family protein [Chloroflexi bacterium]|nr:vitamin K epoxide reductase family protein [Chloroflexota bacterium]
MNKKLSLLTILLALLGALDALYLFVYKISSNDKMCLGSGDCATVNYSRYSEIAGIPVALLGLLAYLTIIILLSLALRKPALAGAINLLVFSLGLAGLVFSVYLTYIELAVIDAVCPFCVISAVLITLIFILSVIQILKTPAH